MNVRVAKEEIVLMMPTTLSRFAPAGEHDSVDARSGTIFARIAGAVRWVLSFPSRNAVIEELSILSDRELADIGLVRDDLSRVFDQSFATDRNRAREENALRSFGRRVTFNA